jgi:prolyl oligopeptidase PreP (S9A serine peptidase family)
MAEVTEVSCRCCNDTKAGTIQSSLARGWRFGHVAFPQIHHWLGMDGDYGSSDNEEEFRYLLGYSPLHNIKEGVHYPATLVMTADHDDRVVPAHSSFKFIATLQEKHKGSNPVLIRIETKAGHGAGKPTAKRIEEAADLYSFMMYNLGVKL